MFIVEYTVLFWLYSCHLRRSTLKSRWLQKLVVDQYLQRKYTLFFFIRKASLDIVDSALDSLNRVLLCSLRIATDYECD